MSMSSTMFHYTLLSNETLRYECVCVCVCVTIHHSFALIYLVFCVVVSRVQLAHWILSENVHLSSEHLLLPRLLSIEYHQKALLLFFTYAFFWSFSLFGQSLASTLNRIRLFSLYFPTIGLDYCLCSLTILAITMNICWCWWCLFQSMSLDRK